MQHHGALLQPQQGEVSLPDMSLHLTEIQTNQKTAFEIKLAWYETDRHRCVFLQSISARNRGYTVYIQTLYMREVGC